MHNVTGENSSLNEGLHQFSGTEADVIEENMDVVDEEFHDSQDVHRTRFKRVVDRGTVLIEPDMNVSVLLGPLPELSLPETLCSSGETYSTLSSGSVLPDYPTIAMADSDPPTKRNLNSYLNLCRLRFSYTELECEYASIVYDFIDQGGASGIEQNQLKSIIEEYENGTIRMVQEELGSVAGNLRTGLSDTEHMSLLDTSQDSRGDFDATLISLINFEMVSRCTRCSKTHCVSAW